MSGNSDAFRGRLGIVLPVLLLSANAICHASTNRAAARPARGFSYYRDDIPQGPWSIHVVKVDRSSRNLELHTALGKGAGFGLAPLSEQVNALPAGLGWWVAVDALTTIALSIAAVGGAALIILNVVTAWRS